MKSIKLEIYNASINRVETEMEHRVFTPIFHEVFRQILDPIWNDIGRDVRFVVLRQTLIDNNVFG